VTSPKSVCIGGYWKHELFEKLLSPYLTLLLTRRPISKFKKNLIFRFLKYWRRKSAISPCMLGMTSSCWVLTQRECNPPIFSLHLASLEKTKKEKETRWQRSGSNHQLFDRRFEARVTRWHLCCLGVTASCSNHETTQMSPGYGVKILIWRPEGDLCRRVLSLNKNTVLLVESLRPDAHISTGETPGKPNKTMGVTLRWTNITSRTKNYSLPVASCHRYRR